MATIRFDNLTKRYPDGRAALEQFDLTIDDGEFVVLVGPSGSGKSTALRTIAGLERATSGELSIDGVIVNDIEPAARDVAMVFQTYALYPHMTVAQNMGFALRLAKVDKREIRSRVERTAELLELSDQLERRPAQLSGGQRQRVAMGRAIVREPRAFLMDEPLSNLDAKLRSAMRATIRSLQRTLGTTTVYVTHDQTEAMTLGDRVALIDRGRLQQVGTPQQLYRRPANLFVAGFVGTPAMNLLPGRIDGGRLVLPLGALPLEQVAHALGRAPQSEDVVVGIRPEHLLGSRPSGSGGRWHTAISLVETVGDAVYGYFGSDPDERWASHPAVRENNTTGVVGAPGIAMLDAGAALRAGDLAELSVMAERVIVFDAVDGRNLCRDELPVDVGLSRAAATAEPSLSR